MDNNGSEVESSEGLLLNSIWELYRKEKGQAICLICTHIISTKNSSTSGLHSHANNVHKRFAKKKTPITPKEKPAKKPDLDNMEILSKQYPLESRLAHLTACDGISFHQIKTSAVLREGLQDSLNKLKAKTTVPLSDKTIRKLVMNYGGRVKQLIQQKLQQKIKAGEFLSCDFDEYSSVAGRRYINVSVFDQSGQFWNLGLVRIIGKADAITVLKLVNERLADFGIDSEKHIVSFITDGAKVMQKLHKHSPTEKQLCLVHGIHLAVLDVLYEKKSAKKLNNEGQETDDSVSEDENLDDEKNTCEADYALPADTEDEDDDNENPEDDDAKENDQTVSESDNMKSSFCVEETGQSLALKSSSIKAVIHKIRALAKHFKRSVTDSDKLQEIICEKMKTKQGLKLKQDVKTRWSSLYEMLERYNQIKDSVDEAVKTQGIGIKVSHNEKCIVRCLINALKPIALTVKVLCRRDSNLLQARTALKMLFSQLEKQKNPLSEALLRQLRIRIKDRWTINASALYYLQSGSLNDMCIDEEYEDSDEEDNEDLAPYYNFMFPDLNAEDQENTPALVTSDVFKLHKKHEIKDHLIKLINRLFPLAAVPVSIDPEQSSSVADSPPMKKRRTFEERLNLAVGSVENPTKCKVSATKQSETSKTLTAEMNFIEKNNLRGKYLQKCYDTLLTIKPTSVESERAFSSVGAICTKIKSRFNDDTLNILSMLRITLRHPQSCNL